MGDDGTGRDREASRRGGIGRDARAALRSRREPRWLGLLVAVGVVVAMVVVARPGEPVGDGFGPVAQVVPLSQSEAAPTTAPAIDHLAPNFRLETLDGGEILLSDLRGRPVFLNFWATWCTYCITEMPAMQRLVDRSEGAFTVIGVNVREEPARIGDFTLDAGIRYPILLDRDGAVTKTYQARQLPTSLCLDANGVIRGIHDGVLTPSEMEEFLRPLIDQAP